jgi:hypothetical protein
VRVGYISSGADKSGSHSEVKSTCGDEHTLKMVGDDAGRSYGRIPSPNRLVCDPILTHASSRGRTSGDHGMLDALRRSW